MAKRLTKAEKQELNKQGLKYCPKCETVKSLDEFGKHSSNWDGKQTQCKCCKAKVAVQYYEVNKEQIKVVQAKYNATPAGKASQAKYNASPAGKAVRAEYNASPKGKASKAKAGAKNRATPAGKASQAKYQTSPKGKAAIKKKDAKRRALELNAPSDDWTHKELFDSADWKCFFCGCDVVEPNRAEVGYQPIEAHAEHFVALSKGGTNMRANMVCSCGKCNISKGTKSGFEVLDGQVKKIQAFLAQNSYEYFLANNHYLYVLEGLTEAQLIADFAQAA